MEHKTWEIDLGWNHMIWSRIGTSREKSGQSYISTVANIKGRTHLALNPDRELARLGQVSAETEQKVQLLILIRTIMSRYIRSVKRRCKRVSDNYSESSPCSRTQGSLIGQLSIRIDKYNQKSSALRNKVKGPSNNNWRWKHSLNLN